MKLSQKKARRLAFVASKMALAYDQDERLSLLGELLDEFGIDAEQRTDSKESAARRIRYTAQQRRKAARQADDIDNMKRDDLRRYIDELTAKRDELLAQRAKRPDIDAMRDEGRAAYQQHLMRSIAAKLEPTPEPEPAPTVTEADTYNVTAAQRRRLAAFDDLTDGDQVDSLKAMWA